MEDAKDPDEYINKFGAVRFGHLLDHSEGAVNFELMKPRTELIRITEVGKMRII